jgi:hypothetical protein
LAEHGGEWNDSGFGLPPEISDAVDLSRSLRFADERRDKESGHNDCQLNDRRSHNGPCRPEN